MPTYTAASCEEADVQAKINLATHGDIVEIPDGDCTWTSQVSVSVGLHLRGAGQGVTIIRDNITKDGSAGSVPFVVSVNAPNNFEMSAFTLVGVATDPSVFNKGYVNLSGTQTAFRIHHITISNAETSFVVTGGCPYGLIDHVNYEGDLFILSAQLPTCGGSNYGDTSWASASTFGTAESVYIEDSSYTGSYLHGNQATDGYNGGKFVFRYNTLYLGNLGSHGTDSSQRQRSIRHQEVYNNTFTFEATSAPDFITWVRGGTGLVFNNAANGQGGLNSFIKGLNLRDDSSFSPWGQCNGSSQYDENATGGYRCVDQPGAGQSDDLGGTETPPDGWVGNAKEPIYQWNNTATLVTAWISGSTNVVNNRDYFQQASGIQTSSSSPFNGTSGTGWGTLANRPSTCTAGAGSTPGVGYFATDEQKLYRCTATDQWTLYYTPYTYPHPLQSGNQETPAVPSTQVPVRKTRLHWLGGFGRRRKH